MDYKEKYLKYKNKYLQLKNQIGSAQELTVNDILNDKSDPRRFLYKYLEYKCTNEENKNNIKNYLANYKGLFSLSNDILDNINSFVIHTFKTKESIERSIGENKFGPISLWDVSQVTNMSKLFKFKPTFNEHIGDWNVSNVTDMSFMFHTVENFNHDISNWLWWINRTCGL